MSLVSDSLILLVWFLVFVIILFLYVDVRVGKLRKELLQHYALCEKMVSAVLKKQEGSYAYRCDIDDPYSAQYNRNGSSNSIFPRVIPAAVDDDLIPTAAEMTQGLRSLDNMSTQMKQNEWMQTGMPTSTSQSNIQTPATVLQPPFHAFDNWEFLGGDFAPFRVL